MIQLIKRQESEAMDPMFRPGLHPWTATILGHDEEIYSTEAAMEIPIC